MVLTSVHVRNRGLVLGTNDEFVGLFRVKGPGHAYVHTSQDHRINIHLCLSGCNGSQITVAGQAERYFDGSLFAFEDRADHEIANSWAVDRINLVIGVLHPDFDPVKYQYPSPNNRLHYVISSLQSWQ